MRALVVVAMNDVRLLEVEDPGPSYLNVTELSELPPFDAKRSCEIIAYVQLEQVGDVSVSRPEGRALVYSRRGVDWRVAVRIFLRHVDQIYRLAAGRATLEVVAGTAYVVPVQDPAPMLKMSSPFGPFASAWTRLYARDMDRNDKIEPPKGGA